MTTALAPIEVAKKSKPPIRKTELISAMLMRAEQKHAELDKKLKAARDNEEREIAALIVDELNKKPLNAAHVSSFCSYSNTVTLKPDALPAKLKARIQAFRNMPHRAPEFRKERVREEIREAVMGEHKPNALELLENPEMLKAIDAALEEV
jgi:hypothetical protein